MSRTAYSRTTGASLLVGAVIGALALSGCGAGQVASTARQVAAVGGSNGSAGSLVVRDAQIEFGDAEIGAPAVYQRGDDAPLQLTIISEGTEGDRLVSASSPWASSVTVSGDTEVPPGRSVFVSGEAEAVPAPASGAPSAAPSGAPSAAPSATATEGTQIVLTGLLDDVRAGLTYPVVLTFERAGELRLDVPVANPEEPREDAEHSE